MDEESLRAILDQLKIYLLNINNGIDHSYIWNAAHSLAVEGYLPAKDLFENGLENEDWVWRLDCVRLLGFHYVLGEKILNKIRFILLNDKNTEVRMSAASVLGNQGDTLDDSLLIAIKNDKDNDVKISSFLAVLKQFNLPYSFIQKMEYEISIGLKDPTIEELLRICKTYSLSIRIL